MSTNVRPGWTGSVRPLVPHPFFRQFFTPEPDTGVQPDPLGQPGPTPTSLSLRAHRNLNTLDRGRNSRVPTTEEHFGTSFLRPPPGQTATTTQVSGDNMRQPSRQSRLWYRPPQRPCTDRRRELIHTPHSGHASRYKC